jgi:hypothetical protein
MTSKKKIPWAKGIRRGEECPPIVIPGVTPGLEESAAVDHQVAFDFFDVLCLYVGYAKKEDDYRQKETFHGSKRRCFIK